VGAPWRNAQINAANGMMAKNGMQRKHVRHRIPIITWCRTATTGNCQCERNGVCQADREKWNENKRQEFLRASIRAHRSHQEDSPRVDQLASILGRVLI
jgi:hypothetical protein